jgi:hypothetical protein
MLNAYWYRYRCTAGLMSLLLLTFVGVVRAQDYIYATGSPTFGVNLPVENGFVNVTNGNLHIEIPLASHEQRGTLRLNERLVYDSRIWKIIDNGGYSWQPVNVPNSMAGWRLTTGTETGTTSWHAKSNSVSCVYLGKNVNATQITYGAFQWTDPQGTVHLFDASTWGASTCPSDPGSSQPSASAYAVDGSGYSLSVNNYTDMTVYDRDGNEVYPQPTDSNGNYWSKDASGNLVDTLGRVPVITTTNGNQIYYDVLTVGGTRARYTVTTETINVNTYFQQSAVSEFSGTLTAIQSIQLPDGSSYSFAYDSGSLAGVGYYGELASITLPTGSTVSVDSAPSCRTGRFCE